MWLRLGGGTKVGEADRGQIVKDLTCQASEIRFVGINARVIIANICSVLPLCQAGTVLGSSLGLSHLICTGTQRRV